MSTDKNNHVMTNTLIFHDENSFKLAYHQTIVGCLRGENIFLDSGGYYTKTTTKRFNQFMELTKQPYRIHQHKGEFQVYLDGSLVGVFTHTTTLKVINHIWK